MIELSNLSKGFSGIQALQDASFTIQKGSIFGLIGSNGAGKSTLLQLIAGVYRPDGGTIRIDGQPVYEQEATKQRFFYISDDQYSFPNSTMKDMARYYAGIYQSFSWQRFQQLTGLFHLDPDRKLSTFSKGMQKQAHIIQALSCQPDYLLCDETFDGLDPVMRQMVKRLLADEVLERNMTTIIASHNLRELEDICDHVGLLHKGGILFEREIDQLQSNIHKVQCAFSAPKALEDFQGLEIVSHQQRGSLSVLVIRGQQQHSRQVLEAMEPLYLEMLPLTLEEIFITEMEVLGYDIQQLIY